MYVFVLSVLVCIGVYLQVLSVLVCMPVPVVRIGTLRLAAYCRVPRPQPATGGAAANARHCPPAGQDCSDGLSDHFNFFKSYSFTFPNEPSKRLEMISNRLMSPGPRRAPSS